MKNTYITQFEERIFPKTKIHPNFRPGDSIRVNYKIEESTKGASGEKKYRIQSFEGVCLRHKKGTVDSSFTVRKIGANRIGVERVFPMCSPFIDSIELVSGGQVRRARLYYLRDLSGKAARIKSRRLPQDALVKTKHLNEDGTEKAPAQAKSKKAEEKKAAKKSGKKSAKKK